MRRRDKGISRDKILNLTKERRRKEKNKTKKENENRKTKEILNGIIDMEGYLVSSSAHAKRISRPECM